jgi:hypothetical protein
MTDYKCPSCGGGFPQTGHHGECPWCGKEMDDDHDTGIGAPVETVPTNRTSRLGDGAARFGDALGDWQQGEPIRDVRVRRNSRNTLLEDEP